MHKATSSAPDIDQVLEEAQKTPFTERMSRADMSSVIKLKILNYDGETPGTTDPITHITAFTIATSRARILIEDRVAVICQLFIEKLTGAALQWFSKFKPRIIDSFNELTQAFMKHYSILVPHEESPANMWNVKQGPSESLCSFIA
ncbi:hypothetical protein V5N11_013625 [Cardamine amara subsp. amara]|uniref:Retrotransposon gag domain-containing protein n=1 Tax=Cardamine amara subsp. amara TaxID=228776 RepID=A0ABD0ZTP3_CARAN